MMKFEVWLPAFVLVFLATAALAEDSQTSAPKFSFTAIDESERVDFASFKGKAVLVVNTASFCGFTKQYAGLEQLWRDHKAAGLVVVGVPSNDFGAQEPGSEKEIKQFCQGAFNISFPLTSKTHVRGPKAHGFYKWVSKITSGEANPRWNFHKLLIGPNGNLVEWFPSSEAPGSDKVRRAVKDILTKSQSAG